MMNNSPSNSNKNSNLNSNSKLDKETDKEISVKYLVKIKKIFNKKFKISRRNPLHISITKITKFL